MGLPRTLFAVGFVFMFAAITYALVAGDFFGEARVLFKYPWFHTSMADLYTGFFLFSGWLIYREKSWPSSIIWIFLILTLGNLTTCAYAFYAAATCGNSWNKFWLGKRYSAGV